MTTKNKTITEKRRKIIYKLQLHHYAYFLSALTLFAEDLWAPEILANWIQSNIENELGILCGQNYAMQNWSGQKARSMNERAREREMHRTNSSKNNCINTCTEWINGWLPFCFGPFMHCTLLCCAALRCTVFFLYCLLACVNTHTHCIYRLLFIVQFHIFIH